MYKIIPTQIDRETKCIMVLECGGEQDGLGK